VTGLLSIVWRELAVGARQTSTHRGRFISGVIVVTFFTLFLALQNVPPNILGPMLFALSSFLLFVQALLSGVRYTADALSEEKRDGTLGLLFLTELRSVEVVLGKMLVRSLRGLYALIATLPVFTFCILLGGVRGVDAFDTALVLVITMIFSLAAGIFVSSCTSEDKTAFLGTIGFLIALCLLPLIVWKTFSSITNSSAMDFLLYASPFYAMHTSPRVGIIIGEFVRSIAGLLVLTIVFLTVAAHNLTVSFKRGFAEPIKSDRKIRIISKRRLSHGLESNPFRWLLERENLYERILAVVAAVAVAGSIILVALTKKLGLGMNFAIGIYSLYFIHLLWKLLVTSDALRRLHHDRRSGALEQLLVTPLPVEQILSAQLNRTSRVFLPSALALAIANFTFFTQAPVRDLNVVSIGGAIFLFIDARALTWRAMLQALTPSRYPVAILRVAGATLLPPIFIMMLIWWTTAPRGISSNDANSLFLFWFVGCAVYDMILIHKAKEKLNNEFRLLAADSAKPTETRSRPLPRFLQWLLLVEPKPAHLAT
jgi:ABC-type transport system involved in cytochrome c biogenesis permease component